MLKLQESKKGMTFGIHVTPHASRAEIVCIQDGVFKVRVTAPPMEGAANAACIKLLAGALGLKKSQVRIFSGAKSRKKIVMVKDIGRTDLESIINSFVKENKVVEQESFLENI